VSSERRLDHINVAVQTQDDEVTRLASRRPVAAADLTVTRDGVGRRVSSEQRLDHITVAVQT